MKISNFKTNEDLETNGVWVDIGEGARLLVARMNNPNFQKMFTKLTEPHRKALQRNTLDEAVLEDIAIRCVAKTVLLDWSGWQGDDGADVPYSEEKALEWLRDLKDFRALVREISTEQATFRETLDEADLKN